MLSRAWRGLHERGAVPLRPARQQPGKYKGGAR